MGDSRPRTPWETRVAQLYNYATLIQPRTGLRQHAAGVSETDRALLTSAQVMQHPGSAARLASQPAKRATGP